MWHEITRKIKVKHNSLRRFSSQKNTTFSFSKWKFLSYEKTMEDIKMHINIMNI